MPWRDAMGAVAEADAVVALYPEALGDHMAVAVKAYEGLALGKPVLAITAGGGTERLLRDLGQDAGCAREDDPESVASALTRLLDDPPAAVAPERLAAFDRRQVAARYAALLDELVATSSRT